MYMYLVRTFFWPSQMLTIKRVATFGSRAMSVGVSTPSISEIKHRFWDLGDGSITLNMNGEAGSTHNFARVHIQNKGIRNAMSGKMMCQLHDISLQLEKYSAKLKEQPAGGDLTTVKTISNPEGGRQMSMLMHDALRRIRSLPLVSVCLVNGRCLGGGAELTLYTDFRVFTAAGSLAFVQGKMGVATGWGGGKRLVDLVGKRAALKILLSCSHIDSHQAVKLGLCDHILENDHKAEKEVFHWIEALCQHHEPSVLHVTKSIVRNACENHQTLDEALNEESLLFSTLWGGEANKRALDKNLKH